jgi:uncharacterized protein involved in response to NO
MVGCSGRNLKVALPARAPGSDRTWDIWAAPYRPLFLAASLCAIFAIFWWPLAAQLWLPAGSVENPVIWHAHEMLFGFVGAAVGGYLLTALPSWTGHPPLHGAELIGLTLMWVLARLVAAFAGHLPLIVLLLPGAGYFLLLTGSLLCRIIAAKAWRKIGFCGATAALGIADVVFLVQAERGYTADSLEIARGMIFMISILASVIGNKAIPAFTANWLMVRGAKGKLPRAKVPVSAVIVLAAALILQGAGWNYASAWSLLIAAGLLLWPMRNWRSVTIWSDPLLAMLHLAYLWLPLGIGLVGLTRMGFVPLPNASALHVITIGAMGGLIFAFAGRAVARRVDGGLQAAPGFALGAVLVWFAVPVRLAENGTGLASLLWGLGWALFVVGFILALRQPPPWPVLSGRRAHIPKSSHEI